MSRIAEFLKPALWQGRTVQVVPPSGYSAGLTIFTSAAMAFLAIFALALSLAAGRLANRWSLELARTATVRISAPAAKMAAQTEAALKVLRATPGVASVRVLDESEERALLEPWFGTDLALESLPIPTLIEVVEAEPGIDAVGLRLRLRAEAPAAILDDHTRWRQPLVAAAQALRFLGYAVLVLIGAISAAMITMAANASLAANGQVIRVLRLVGARDTYIARAFVRRFTLRAFFGALAGTIIGALVILSLPEASAEGGFLTGLGFQGAQWLWPLLIAPLASAVAFVATRMAAFRALGRYT